LNNRFLLVATGAIGWESVQRFWNPEPVVRHLRHGGGVGWHHRQRRPGDDFLMQACRVLKKNYKIGQTTLQIESEENNACSLAPDSVV
jgi:Co/Zn/Cd efflux system component